MSINLKKNHPVYELAFAVMQRVLSLLVLQIAALWQAELTFILFFQISEIVIPDI